MKLRFVGCSRHYRRMLRSLSGLKSEIVMPCLNFRSHHRRCTLKKVALKIFSEFTGKHQCRSLLFSNVTGLQIKKETPTLVFFCEH